MRTRLILFGILVAIVSMISVHGQTPVSKKKILIAYFSHSGNTRVVAQQIQKATGADIFEIKPVKDYPTDYRTVVDQAKKEIKAGYRPPLKNKVANISNYDIILIGSPNWWSTIAPPVATFLSSYNFDGKTIVPFITHGGSELGRATDDIKKLCPKSTHLEGLAIWGRSVNSDNAKVLIWLRKMKFIN
ncbi:flavodoxin [Paludibacter jiangxiensis]|uniref:Flavodoxin n=1 Tax=Paludibacter jiangxiensis TaxID=681398 RepID=A0A161LGI6_9BACT|nr:flavodoxin [Paludibacter jiangxiensis]GAT64037.1 flavodoxin [Paludibacter jiangxiensis]